MSDLTKSNEAAPSTKTIPCQEQNPLTSRVLDALRQLAIDHGILKYDLTTHPIAGLGENSFGMIFQATLTPIQDEPILAVVQPFICILKISPKNQARRTEMNVVEYYRRETFMYKTVLSRYCTLRAGGDVAKADNAITQEFDIIPRIYHSSMVDGDEFLIFEDLSQSGFTQNLRSNSPTFDLVEAALCALARLHANSFALQVQQPQEFASIVAQLDDNLFNAEISEHSVEFGRTTLRRTRVLLEEETDAQSQQYRQVLREFENGFKEIGLRCVNGETCRPHAVICHGDFWNNNILYKFDSNKKAIAAKLIDFQLSRYASPVLDMMHYMFVCTKKELRDSHFMEFLQIYYDALDKNMRYFGLDPAVIYPKNVFDNQVREYGPYGLIISAFAVPFFISNMNEIPDLNEVAQVVQDSKRFCKEAKADAKEDADTKKDVDTKASAPQPENTSNVVCTSASEVVSRFDFINERTLPTLQKRMTDIVADLVKYDMLGSVINLQNN